MLTLIMLLLAYKSGSVTYRLSKLKQIEQRKYVGVGPAS